jgi:hypothetical protein
MNILNDLITLEKFTKEKLSISRFGDGEFFHLFNSNYNNASGRQKCSKEIKLKLEKIINSESEKILIGISGFLAKQDEIEDNFKDYTPYMKKFIKKTIKNIQNKYPELINKQFYSAEITRITNSKYQEEIIKIFDNYFGNNDFVFVGNKMVIKLIKNKFIDKFKKIQFIEVKKQNAYDDYDVILNQIIKLGKNNIYLLAIGITATILSFDLSEKGFIGVDIGHYFELLEKRNKRLKGKK